jgi:transcriptional regulator with XRE-family HTH domain
MPKNVDISSPEFRKRLIALRRRKGLSRRTMADAIGVTTRAYTNWETGKQRSAMEHNLLRLAEVLEVDFDYLVHGEIETPAAPPAVPDVPAPPRPRYNGWRTPAIVIAVVVGLAALLAFYSSWSHGVYLDVSGSRLVARDPLLKFPRWRIEHDSAVKSATTVDCRLGRLVVYGLSGDTPDTGRLFARRSGDGKELWHDTPNFVETSRVFGSVGGEPPGYGVRDIDVGDIDGDGQPEIVARFGHNLWYPNYVRTYRCDGTVMGTYYNCGAIYDTRVIDLDNDGKDEILAAATNNGRAYQGATLFILDDTHLNGASSDSLMMTDCPLADSSLVRVVFPAWEPRFMTLCGADNDGARLSAGRLRIGPGPKGATIAADIQVNEWPLVMTLDTKLHALSISPSDTFQRLMETWNEADRRDFLAYLDRWKSTPYRYGELAAR